MAPLARLAISATLLTLDLLTRSIRGKFFFKDQAHYYIDMTAANFPSSISFLWKIAISKTNPVQFRFWWVGLIILKLF